MCGSSPPAPDYTGAAEAQGQSSQNVTRDQTWANRPDINTPMGNFDWTAGTQIDPATGRRVTSWELDVNLTPEQQAALDAQNRLTEQRSGLAGTLYDRMQAEQNQGIDWGAMPAWGTNPGTRGMAQNYGMGTVQTGFNTSGVPAMGQSVSPQQTQMGVDLGDVNLQRDLSQRSDAGLQQNLSQQGNVDFQRQYAYGDAPAMPDSSQVINQRGVDAAYEQYKSRLDPMWEQNQAAMRSQLVNQGLDPTSQAYRTQMDTLARQRTDAYDTALRSAVGQGAQIGGQMFGQDLSARQQGVGEATNQGNLWNQTGLQNANLYNQAQLAAGTFGNEARLQGANLYNQAQLAAGNFANAASLAQQGFNNQAALDEGQFANQAAQQAFNQDLGSQQFQNALNQQGYNQALGTAEFQNQAAQQYTNQARDAALFQNQSNQAMFDNSMQASQYQNQLRQAQVAEQLQKQGWTLNQINALLSGQQVNMPNQPQFSNATKADPTNYLGAANMAGQYGLDATAQDNAWWGDLMGGLGSLGSAGAFAFSDKRLKKNIKRHGDEIAPGVKRATWNWKGSGRSDEGAIAQDVEKKYPKAVREDPETGMKKINYAFLFAKKLKKGKR